MLTETKIEKYIQTHNLLKKGAKIIVGTSGGADSMTLLNILINLDYDCIAAHCNFHLRGSESDRDQFFVKEYCKANNIKFVSIDFDTKSYMYKHGVSLEMAARQLRYNWFEEIRKQHEADNIAVAHHQDDSIETLLINLMRGTGIKGLTGIPPQNGYIVRPLISLSKTEIIEYLKYYNIEYITDSTNNEDIYIRNKIRLTILPLLKTINPAVEDTLTKTISNLSATRNIYNAAVQNSIQNVFKQNKIYIDLLLAEIEPKTILFEILHPFGFNSDMIDNIFEAIHAQSGKIFLSKHYKLIKDRSFFILEEIPVKDKNISFQISENDKEIEVPIKLNIQEIKRSNDFVISKNINAIYVDKEKITYPLTIRKWEAGDIFVPFGMKGKKKVSDYFTDHKFSIVDKENVWLLCSADGDIVWIINNRADNRFRISDTTLDILKISTIIIA